ncbi:MAG: hypothetical protein R3345_13935 [Fulvivirga sp.]|nr:hypothetical protein [Fulvivirga sp.]
MAKKKKEEKKKKPTVNPDLEGFDISIDSFGEISTNYNIDKINEFLNKNVEDKKLVDRKDYEELKKGKKESKSENEEDKD